MINLEKLNKLLLDLDDKFDINSGGCCFVSFCLALNFKYLGIPYKVIGCSHEYISNRQFRRNLKNNRGYFTNDDTGCHYYLLVNGIEINKGGYNKGFYNINSAAYVTPEELYAVYIDGCWNDDYDIFYNSLVFSTISKFFKDEEEKEKRASSR